MGLELELETDEPSSQERPAPAATPVVVPEIVPAVEKDAVSALGTSSDPLARPEGPVSNAKRRSTEESLGQHMAWARRRLQKSARDTLQGLAAAPGVAVGVSRVRVSMWQRPAVWVGGLVAALAVLWAVWPSGHIAPPTMPNPLRARITEWSQAGTRPAKDILASVTRAEEGLAGATVEGVEAAFDLSKSILVREPDHPAGIALYALAVTLMPDAPDQEMSRDLLGAITSAVGEGPEPADLARLEEARAWALIRAERYDAARQTAKQSGDRVGAHVALGAAEASLRPEEAVAILQPLAKGQKPAPRAAAWLGVAELERGNVAAAARWWEGDLARGSRGAEGARRLAAMLAHRGMAVESTAIASRLVREGWASADDCLLLARLQSRELGALDAAAESLDRCLQDQTRPAGSRARLWAEWVSVEVLRANGFRAKEAFAAVDRGLDLAPDYAPLMYVAGLADWLSGDLPRAKESFETALGLHPLEPHTTLQLAFLLRRDDPGEAKRLVSAALGEWPDYIPLHGMAALLAMDAGDRLSAFEAARRAVGYDPTLREERHFLGDYVELPRMSLDLGRELASYGQRYQNAVLLAMAAMVAYGGRHDAWALRWVNLAIKLDRSNVAARLYRALLWLDKSNRRKAAADIEIAYQEDRQAPVVRLLRAQLLETKQPAVSERLYRDLLEQNPLNTGARTGLARALWSKGLRDAAREQAVHALSIRPFDRAALRFLVEHP